MRASYPLSKASPTNQAKRIAVNLKVYDKLQTDDELAEDSVETNISIMEYL